MATTAQTMEQVKIAHLARLRTINQIDNQRDTIPLHSHAHPLWLAVLQPSMSPSNQEQILLPIRPAATPLETGQISTSRSVSCGELKKGPTNPNHKPEWATYASLQVFLDFRRDDLYMAVGPKHPFRRRVAPGTIGKLLDPPPHQEQPATLPDKAVKMKKHSVSQHNIADGDDNEAKHAMTKRQLAHMTHHLSNTDGTNTQCTGGARRKLQKMAKAENLKVPV